MWFNHDEMISLRQDLLNGKWNPVCSMCKEREECGQTSTRQIFNHEFAELEKKNKLNLQEDKAVINDFSKIFHLNITVGNKCNSACLMCNESASSLWAKEQEEITGKSLYKIDSSWFCEENIPRLVDPLINLSSIIFVGGEPTINDTHVILLKRLISLRRSNNISLGYITNLSGISVELLDIWTHFGQKHITISIDGVGAVNEYIRYPFAWSKVMSQLEKLKNIAQAHNITISLSHTLTSLNMLSLDEMIKWWIEQTEICEAMSKEIPHVQCVNKPDFLNPIYMPKEMKMEVDKLFSNLEKYLNEKRLHTKYAPILENIRRNILSTQEDENLREVNWKQMKQFLFSLDEHRNRNIFHYLPKLQKFWN